MDKLMLSPDLFDIFKKYTNGDIDRLPNLYSKMMLFLSHYINRAGPDPVIMYLSDQEINEHFEMCHLIICAIHYHDTEFETNIFDNLNQFDFYQRKIQNPQNYHLIRSKMFLVHDEMQNLMKQYNEQKI